MTKRYGDSPAERRREHRHNEFVAFEATTFILIAVVAVLLLVGVLVWGTNAGW